MHGASGAGKWLIGTGPGGQIEEVSVSPDGASFTSREVAKLGEAQVYALKSLPDGSILAGTSASRGPLPGARRKDHRAGGPSGGVRLRFRHCWTTASPRWPPRAIRDGSTESTWRSSRAPGSPRTTADAKALWFEGHHPLRRGRRPEPAPDRPGFPTGRIVAGSAPKGNIYCLRAEGGAPYIAEENHDAEVTDLLPDPTGGYYRRHRFLGRRNPSGGDQHPGLCPTTEITITSTSNSANPNPAPTPHAQPPCESKNPAEILNAPIQAERFPGPELAPVVQPGRVSGDLLSRSGVAFYRMGRAGDLLLISGGEQGEMAGYDLAKRLSLTFAGSGSSQVNALEAVPGHPGRFFAIRNNAPGFSVIDFDASVAPHRPDEADRPRRRRAAWAP